MAYGDSRTTVATDTFSSGISGDWTNGPGAFGAFGADGSGNVGGSDGTDDAIRRDTETFADDQYSIATFSGTVNNNQWIGVSARMQAGASAECYVGTKDLAGGHAWVLYYVTPARVFGTALAQVAETSNTDPASGDTLTIECEGTTLRLGSDITAPDGQVLSATNSTISGGKPGLQDYPSPSNTSGYSAWEGGDIGATGPTTHEASISYSLSSSTSLAKAAILNPSISYGLSNSMSDGRTLDIPVNASFSLQLSQVALSGAIFNPALGMDLSVTMDPSAVMVAGSSISYSMIMSDQHVGISILQASSIYQSILNATYQGEVIGDLEGFITFAVQTGQTNSAQSDLIASSIFNSSFTLDINAGRDISDSISFALSSSMSQDSIISIEGSLVAGLSMDLSIASDAQKSAAIAFNNQLIFSAIQQGILNAGLSLSVIHSIDITATRVVLGIVTPDGRKIIVNADSRSIVTETDRNIDVSGNPRTITINVE